MTVRELKELPSIDAVRSRWQALAMFDVLLRGSAEHRDFSFDRKWTRTASFGNVDDQQGANLRGAFLRSGAVLRGYDESSPLAWSGSPEELGKVDEEAMDVVRGLPLELRRVFQASGFRFLGSTYCIWAVGGNDPWRAVPILESSPALSSHDLEFLDLFMMSAAEFVVWSREMYEREVPHDCVEHLFNFGSLDVAVLRAFDRMEDISTVRSIAARIGYPCEV